MQRAKPGQAAKKERRRPRPPRGASAAPAQTERARPEGAGSTSVAVPIEPMRIAKAIARAGVCSRRDAERMIAEGRVSLNGAAITSPAVNVGPADAILIDGKPLPGLEPVRLWRHHKPRGRVTTHRDPEGRPTVFEALPPELPRVISVGRLDFNSEGLLLLTNSGALARHLELPATAWQRRYRVRVHGRIAQADLDKLAKGTEIDGVRYGPIDARIDREQGTNMWLTIGLREGKNREVRKIMTSLGLEVTRLIRVSFGPFALGDLAPGAVEEVRASVIADQLGARLAAELGLDTSGSRLAGPRAQTRKEGERA